MITSYAMCSKFEVKSIVTHKSKIKIYKFIEHILNRIGNKQQFVNLNSKSISVKSEAILWFHCFFSCECQSEKMLDIWGLL
jgi:hypothetical protein